MHRAAQIKYDNDLGRLFRYLGQYNAKGRTTGEIQSKFPYMMSISSRLSDLRAQLKEHLYNTGCESCTHMKCDICSIRENPVRCEYLSTNKNGKRIFRWILDLPPGFELVYADAKAVMA